MRRLWNSPRAVGRRWALGIVTGALLSASSCLVLGLDRFYDDAAITFDERLLGVWKDVDDNLSVTVERSEWRSYRVSYTHATESGVLTGYLFTQNGSLCLDLTPVRGQDPGPLMLVAHTMARIVIGANQTTIRPLAYDWFGTAVTNRTLAASLAPVKSERDQIVLSAPGAALREWTSARPADDPAFGPPAIFTRQ